MGCEFALFEVIILGREVLGIGRREIKLDRDGKGIRDVVATGGGAGERGLPDPKATDGVGTRLRREKSSGGTVPADWELLVLLGTINRVLTVGCVLVLRGARALAGGGLAECTAMVIFSN